MWNLGFFLCFVLGGVCVQCVEVEVDDFGIVQQIVFGVFICVFVLIEYVFVVVDLQVVLCVLFDYDCCDICFVDVGDVDECVVLMDGGEVGGGFVEEQY